MPTPQENPFFVEQARCLFLTMVQDLRLNHFYTNSDGGTVSNPRYLRKSEKALKRAQKRVSRKKKGSGNRKKAINKLGRKHLKVSRQRKEFAIKTTPKRSEISAIS
jgi:transposase